MVTAARPPVRDPGAMIARAVLYEGYVLWPYRRGPRRVRRRWTVGGVYPRAWTEVGHEDDAWTLSTECLARLPGFGSETAPTIGATVRFLQVVERRVARQSVAGLEYVDELTVGDERIVSSDEAREREVRLAPVALKDHAAVQVAFDIPAATHREWMPDGRGAVVRSWRALSGIVRVSCRRLADDLFRVGVQTWNTTHWDASDGDTARRSSFSSTHIVMEAEGCSFVSSSEPPSDVQHFAEACKNRRLWPVLVGERGVDETMLAAPIILPDYPQIDPEGLADLLDEGEIDEMRLTLHVLAPTEEEEAGMRASEIRRRMSEPTGVAKRSRPVMRGPFLDPDTPALLDSNAMPPRVDRRAAEPAAGPSETVGVGARRVVREVPREGSRVRLRPRLGGDVFDMVLAGRIGVVESVEQDEDGRPRVIVWVEDAPGTEVGGPRQSGRRLYFGLDEVDLVEQGTGGAAARLRMRASSILVAGIGNVLLGDDGFGVEVVRRLRSEPLPDNVTVRDYGVRGLDLAYAFAEHEIVVLVDAVPRGGEPGTIYLIDATGEEDEQPGVPTHGLDPASVIALAKALGPMPSEIYIVGCEPAVVPDPDADEAVGELSDPVRDALDVAVERVKALVYDLGERFEDRRVGDDAGAWRGTERRVLAATARAGSRSLS